jgi:methionine aminopeptidase
MKPGNVFTIEPVMSIYQSSIGLQMWSDGMTIISDNNPNAQFEHMVLIKEDGC